MESFAQVAALIEQLNGVGQRNEILLQIEVLEAMMEKVKLNKANYVALMRGVKVFVQDKQTQKKGYKILAKVIEKFEFVSIDELQEIKHEITPMIKG